MTNSATVLRAWVLSIALGALAATGCGNGDGGAASTGGGAGSGGAAGADGIGGSAGEDGTGGVGGSAGAGGSAGTGGMGGTGGVMCEDAQDCNDDNPCTDDSCDSIDETCDNMPVENGTVCDAGGQPGSCQAGGCVANPQWGTAEKISAPGEGHALFPRIAFDGNGNAITVWEQADSDGIYHIWANRYALTGGWGSAEQISDGSGAAEKPRLGVDAAGNAIAVWAQAGDTVRNIWANDYTPTGGWGTPRLLEDNPGTTVSPEIGMNADGIAMVVWHQYPPGNGYQNIWARRYTPDGGWGIVRTVELSQQTSSQPRVAVDLSGDAIATWQQRGGAVNQHRNVWTGRFTPTNGWGTSEQLDDSAIDSSAAEVAIDVNGNAFAVWNQGTASVFAAYYTPTGGWAARTSINGNGTPAAFLNVAFDASGRAMVMWSQSDSSRRHIWNNRYTPAQSWGSAALVAQSQAEANQPSFALNADGNAIGAWYEFSDSYSMQAASYTPSGGWEVSERIDQGGDQFGGTDVAVDRHGHAFVAWHQTDGMTFSIWVNRFD